MRKGVTLKETISKGEVVPIGSNYETENDALFEHFVEKGIIKELKDKKETKELKTEIKTK